MVQHFGDLPGVETDIDDILHHPTHQEYLFNWKQEQETAFQLIKKRMTSAPVLAFYNVKKPVTVSCDVSNFGLGAVLLQENKPIAYASSALTDTEKRYAQIEKELLAVVYALEKFNQYVYEVCKLEDTSSTSIITHTTSVLAQHGIPMVIRSDNGTQYTAEEYKRFTKEWGIQHVTTSPYHTQANGLAEKSVQIIKSLLNQSKANNQDPYLSLLEYRNTTVDNVGSPAQLLMG
eukprot:Em0025g28a